MKSVYVCVSPLRRVRRFTEGGALSLNRCKLMFTLDDDGNPTGFRDYPLHDTNRMVGCLEIHRLKD